MEEEEDNENKEREEESRISSTKWDNKEIRRPRSVQSFLNKSVKPPLPEILTTSDITRWRFSTSSPSIGGGLWRCRSVMVVSSISKEKGGMERGEERE